MIIKINYFNIASLIDCDLTSVIYIMAFKVFLRPTLLGFLLRREMRDFGEILLLKMSMKSALGTHSDIGYT
jgi:hypothetical protein